MTKNSGKKTIVHNPHDKLFKTALQYPEVAKEFLQLYLPSHIKKNLNFNTITYCSTTFIDEELKLSQTDVLFKAKVSDKDAYIYILAEHESEIDNLIAFWIMKYLVAIWDYHIKAVSESKALPLPLIFPLIFYTGDKPYTASCELWQLFGEKSQAMQAILQSPFYLIDVSQLPEEALTSHIFAGTMAFMLRKYFRKNIKSEIIKIIDNLNALESCEMRRYLVDLIKYTFGVDEGHKNMNELRTLFRDKASSSVEKNHVKFS